ncbi:hypothetical protein FH972_021242 [Carpinus fangiana]|uniref:Uncharacterized protein n=1 Tax=Carpinus fangiana TaxID=176857 RepID=A0A5N6KQY4_9ROSI|nr:hypothetical protein FH972_021242 [Carpinus fangiana]
MATTAAAVATRPSPTPPDSHGSASQPSKRPKGRKPADPANTSKAIEDTIAQLERNKEGEREQEQEIDREVRRATRDMSKDLSKIQDPLARIDAVQKKYAELYANMRRTEREHIAAKKRADQLQKEKDASRSELSKTSTVKDKLEKLCRELQKDNKKLKEDNKRLLETETRMRDELHVRLEGMVSDIQEVIDQKEHPDRIPANMEQDELFRHKFKSFIDQYELRELHMQSLLRQKQLEIEFQTARYEQQRRAQEQEVTKSRGLANQVSTFSQTETELRSQLNIYVEKFKQRCPRRPNA